MTALEQAYALCEEITESKGPNFSVGFRTLPTDKRHAVHASYAFCRLVDDLVDEAEDRTTASLVEALDRWRAELDAAYEGEPEHPVAVALADAVHRFPVPRRAFADLILGCEEDLRFAQPEGLDALERYCDLVATPIGEMSLAIFGVLDRRAEELGRRLSHALQWTNILRDVREDALRGRVYLPRPWLELEGLFLEDLAEGRESDGFVRLMRRGIEVAREHFHAAAPLADLVERDSRLAVRLMGGVYAEILARIASNPVRVLRERVGLSEGEKQELVARFGGPDAGSERSDAPRIQA